MNRKTKVASPIGKLAVIRSEGQQHVATVIDATPDLKAKRVRVQSPGPIQGNVLMPGGYVLVEFLEGN